MKDIKELMEVVLMEDLITFNKKAYPKFGNVVILAGGAGCLARNTKILMFDGIIKNVQDIETGDLLMGVDSKSRTITKLYNGVESFLKVDTKKGHSYKSNISHIHSFRCSFSKCGFKKGQIYNMTYNEWLNIPESAKKSLKIYGSDLIKFNNQDVDFDPWFVGLWLGDGTIGVPHITIEDGSPLIKELERVFENEDYYVNQIKSDKKKCRPYSITKQKGEFSPLRNFLKENCCVGGEKRIPKEYLINDENTRKSLLAGLIDSDGYNGGKYYEIITKFDGLKDDIIFLCNSLGYNITHKIKIVNWRGENREYHRLTISGDFDDLPIILKYKQSSKRKQIKNVKNYGYTFTELSEEEYFGFSIEEEDKRYILGNGLVTHNSGKGFVLSNLLGIEGNVNDVDVLKALAIASKKFAKKVKDEIGVDIKKLKLNKPENVSKIHEILSIDYGLPNKKIETLFRGVASADPERKPNLIFDVTLKNITKLHNITNQMGSLGYDKKNIHIVWVVNDVAVAAKQNKERSRVVPEDIFLDTHEGASLTMKKVIDMGDKVRKYIDGDIWLAFNQAKIDSTIRASGRGGKYISKSNFIKIKETGKGVKTSKDLTKDVYNKIKNYVPAIDIWK